MSPNQELSEYLTQPYQNRIGGGVESIDRRQGNNTQTKSGPATMDRPHLLGKPWYYGSVTRAQCDNLLNQQGHDGDFLIRDSETNVRVSSKIKLFVMLSILSVFT